MAIEAGPPYVTNGFTTYVLTERFQDGSIIRQIGPFESRDDIEWWLSSAPNSEYWGIKKEGDKWVRHFNGRDSYYTVEDMCHPSIYLKKVS